jgi:hypothetical protein
MDMYESMDSMSTFQTMPYSYFESQSMYAPAPLQTIKQEMQHYHDLPPALIPSGSAPSVPSASSSTVGSPFSGPSHTISTHDEHEYSGSSYGVGGMMPTIVNHDNFSSQDIMRTSMEGDLSLTSLEKVPDSFVGESADLSFSQLRAPAVALSQAQVVQPISRPAIRTGHFCSSPEPMALSTVDSRGRSFTPSITSVSAYSTAAASPATEHTPPTPIFKSPITPASAFPRQCSLEKPKNFTPTPRSHANSSPQFHMSPQPNLPSQHVQNDRFQAHFFAQSSGNFMPPLETSCSSLPFVSCLPLPSFSRYSHRQKATNH